MRLAYRRTLVCSALLGLTVTTGVQAETAERAIAGGLDEIVVTATRREERLQDVPISISAFSQEKLDAQGLKNIDDVSRLAPGITFSRNGTGSSANYNDENSDINIRGVDSTAGTSTTGIYVDDTPVQSRHIGFGAVNIFPALFDLDRVEVLRGPQGTLFGAGAEGGAVRFITPQPNLREQTGYMRAELATTRYGDPSYEAGAAFGGPIVADKLGFRVSASYRRDGGWVDRVAYTLDDPTALNPNPSYASNVDKRANWQQVVTVRGALTWKPTDSLSITPSVYYQRLHINDTAVYWDALSNPSAGIFRNGNALANDSTDPFTLAAVKVDWDLGFAQLTSNTSYLARDQHSTSDYSQYLRATWAYFGLLPNTFPQNGAHGYAPFQDVQRNFYQEIRLSSKDPKARLKWTTGLFYSHLNENIPEDIYDATLSQETTDYALAAYDIDYAICSAELPCPNGLIYTGHEARVVDKQIAAFGEVEYKLTDTIKATVGLRLSKVDYVGTFSGTGPFLGETVNSSFSASEHAATPKAVLSWSPDRDNMVYASASKGFRPGGVNTGVGGICDGDLTTLGLPIVDGRPRPPNQYDSDSLWSFEVGGKNTLLDHRLQVNTSIFFINWKNIQQNVYLPSCGEQFTANLGKAESKGADIDLTFRPVNELSLNLSVAYTDAKFTKTSCAGVLAFDGTACSDGIVSVAPIASKGDALLGSPWSLMGSVEYRLPQWGDRNPYVRLDFQHSAAQTKLLPTQNDSNALYDTTIPGLPVTNNLNLRAGVRFSGLDLSLFVNNLTDAHPLMFRSRDIADASDQLYFNRGVRPRTIGVTATYHY
jgi:outer membrane receptor protein involved in Fe transport